MFQEKMLKNFDLSHLYIIDDDVITLIDKMCPTIKSLTLKGNNLDLWFNQSISDVIIPFRFLTKLNLSRCCAVDTLSFLWQAPITLKELHLDFLSVVPADDFVQFIPVLSNQLTHLSMTHNIQLTKYDLVNILQRFWKLSYLNIVCTEYLTPGTCDTITRYCYNLEQFYFSLDFRIRDMKAWIALLGIELQHVEFTEEVNEKLQSYYEIENYYENGHNFDEVDDW